MNVPLCALGNELSGSGVGARIGADQYAADVINLRSIINEIYQGLQDKPLVLAQGGFLDTNWFTEIISKTKPNSLDVITHHIYNLGPGITFTATGSALYSISLSGRQVKDS